MEPLSRSGQCTQVAKKELHGYVNVALKKIIQQLIIIIYYFGKE